MLEKPICLEGDDKTLERYEVKHTDDAVNTGLVYV